MKALVLIATTLFLFGCANMSQKPGVIDYTDAEKIGIAIDLRPDFSTT